MEASKLEETILNANIISNHKFNFYQQFFVISIDPKIMASIDHYDLKSLQEPYSTPKVISKYPNVNLPYLNIPDSLIASHCFPQGIINEIIEYNDNEDLIKKENKTENFIFTLENMCQQIKTSSLRTNKVYYTCLLFYENIENYRNCINERKNFNNKKDEEQKNKKFLIPKVICLSSFNSFYEQTKNILLRIKNYVNNYNYNNKSIDNLNLYPIEVIIEGLIFNLPSLPRGNFKIVLNNDSFSYTNNNITSNNDDFDLREIIFQEAPPNVNPREICNYSLLMKYFRIEEIFDIIKFIILEEPILFFSEDKEALTNIIESLISLIYPFEYPYPVISILPEQNYSLISLFKHFIFGINSKYSVDFLNKKMILDGIKFIRIIRLEKRFNNILNMEEPDNAEYQIFTSLKFDENKPLIKFNENDRLIYKKEKEDNKLIHDKKKINLPRHYLEKCCKKLEKTTHEKIREIEIKNKIKNKNLINELKMNAFNAEIREEFLYFFCCILLNYQEYCVKYETKIYEYRDKDGNIVEKEFKERNFQLDEKYYNGQIVLNDIFNSEEFINSTPSLDRAFYRVFFGTKLFFSFILKKIFPESNQDKLDILYFDEMINKKLSRELYTQKKETKFLDFELEQLKSEIKLESFKKSLNKNILEYLQKKESRTKALNYFQFIYLNGEDDDSSVDEETSKKDEDIYFYYYVFPILLNDGIFYNEKYKNKNNIWSFLEYSIRSQSSNILFNLFETEATMILEDDNMNKNYLIYNYSLNPTSQFSYKNDFLIKILWLIYLSKTFKSIPNIKKRYYFEIMMNFLQKYQNIIDENTILIIFNSLIRNGDRNMIQDYFEFLKNKTYTSYLYARERIKPENNYTKFVLSQNNNNNNTKENNQNNKEFPNKNKTVSQLEKYILEEKKILRFKVNSFCTEKKEDKNEICNEPFSFSGKISELLSEQEEYIKFKCNRCNKKQNLKICCIYNNDDNKDYFLTNYIINFEILSPIALLQKDWLRNNNDIDPYFICDNYLNCYLSSLFYFYEQNLPCNFLMPEFIIKSELKEEKNNYYSIVNNTEFFNENKIKKIVVQNTPKAAKTANIVLVEEEEKSEENIKYDELIEKSKEAIYNNDDFENTDNMIKLRESTRKQQGYKSSFRKKNRIGSKKKSVEFRLNLKKTKFSED